MTAPEPFFSKLIDTHAHLSDPQFDLDRERVIQNAKENGVETIVEIADSAEFWERAKKLSEDSLFKVCRKNTFIKGHSPRGFVHEEQKERKESLLLLEAFDKSIFSTNSTQAQSPSSPFPAIYWSCGFHPHFADAFSDFNFDIMKKAAASLSCVAVGEIGLDYVKSSASKEKQAFLFKKTLQVAVEADKPVVIHCRSAQTDTLEILKSFFKGNSRSSLSAGVIHCFSGDLSFAEGCMELGFFLGVDGPITYPSAQGLRDVISRVPLNKIVLETDSPYLPPQKLRGKRNEPAHLSFVAQKVAELFQEDLGKVAKVTTENAVRLFRLKA